MDTDTDAHNGYGNFHSNNHPSDFVARVSSDFVLPLFGIIDQTPK